MVVPDRVSTVSIDVSILESDVLKHQFILKKELICNTEFKFVSVQQCILIQVLYHGTFKVHAVEEGEVYMANTYFSFKVFGKAGSNFFSKPVLYGFCLK